MTLATITFQNYFRLYEKLVGHDRHGDDRAGGVLQDLRARRDRRADPPADDPRGRQPTSSSAREDAKFNALIDEIAEMTEAGRPVLVGTTSVEKSEVLSDMLKRRGIKHEVLNAKFHEKEAPIVAQAGRSRRRDHRDQHGRPRHGHPARRQSRGHGLGRSPSPGHQPGRGAAGGLRGGAGQGQGATCRRPRPRSSRRAGCTSSAPSATRRGASTTSCAAAPVARATRARRASTCRSRTCS